MMEQIDLLQKLQHNESRCRRIQADMRKRTARRRELEDALQRFRVSVSAESERIDEIGKRYRSLESDANQIVSQIEKSKAKLRAVKNNKEYQSLLKEIDELKRKHSSVEDEMLQCLESSDTAKQAADAKKEELAERTRRVADEVEQIEQQQARAEMEIAALKTQWEEIARRVEPPLMETFAKIKAKQADGVAIVRVENAVCLGCNVNIPPQMYNELQRKDSLKFCPNCQRIIFWQADGA